MKMVKGVTVVSFPFDRCLAAVSLPFDRCLIPVSSLSHFTTPLDGPCHRDILDESCLLLCLVRRIVC